MPHARLLLLLTTFGVFASACAQQTPDPRNMDASAFGQRIDISSAWLFTPTDAPAYASPAFDDRAWTAISTDRDLLTYGFHDFPSCWYRLHVHLPHNARNIMLALSGTDGQYQAFVNGTRIAGPDTLSPHIQYFQSRLVAYAIPKNVLASARGDLVIALHFSVETSSDRGRGTSSPIAQYSEVFLLSADAAPRDDSYELLHNFGFDGIVSALGMLAALIAFSLFLALRGQREYLAIAIYLLITSLFYIYMILLGATIQTLPLNFLFYFLMGARNVFIIEFVRLVLRLPRTRTLTLLQIASFLFVFASPLSIAGIDPFHLGFIIFFIPIIIVAILLPVLLVRSWTRGNREAAILLPAVLILSLYNCWNFVRFAAFYTHLTTQPGSAPTITLGTWSLSFRQLGDFVFALAVLLFLVLRTVRIARDRARVASELEAAQTMQSLLFSRSSAPTPGFTIESVYLPASEVGGDFFLISPAPGDSITAIVGDVSGKGLSAAMRVSMILGVLRREESRGPAAVLHSLNNALVAQGDMGFTTACCVHLHRDGRFILANAGHISPYIATPHLSHEFETTPALPLGLAGDQDYAEFAGHLPPGARLVLMSDGVVEARTPKGELYGFDRLSTLTTHTAQDIAETAQHFGQEDDITVLTLACCP